MKPRCRRILVVDSCLRDSTSSDQADDYLEQVVQQVFDRPEVLRRGRSCCWRALAAYHVANLPTQPDTSQHGVAKLLVDEANETSETRREFWAPLLFGALHHDRGVWKHGDCDGLPADVVQPLLMFALLALYYRMHVCSSFELERSA